MIIAILTRHVPERGHLYIMGLFDGDPTCRFCRMETETVQHIIRWCEAFARQRYNVFRKLVVEPEDISTASLRDFCLLIRVTGLLNFSWMEYSGLQNKPKASVQKKKKKKKKKKKGWSFMCAIKRNAVATLELNHLTRLCHFLFMTPERAINNCKMHSPIVSFLEHRIKFAELVLMCVRMCSGRKCFFCKNYKLNSSNVL